MAGSIEWGSLEATVSIREIQGLAFFAMWEAYLDSKILRDCCAGDCDRCHWSIRDTDLFGTKDCSSYAVG